MSKPAVKGAAIKLPKPVSSIIDDLEKAGHEAYAVGGGVRDTLLGRPPKDWDVATNASPKQIQVVFPHSVYANRFGTVGVKRGPWVYEVTTYRVETTYTDARHPDQVKFVKRLEDDLARRDFTVNALAAGRQGIVDPFGGQADLKAKLIRAVGTPEERFQEDALRLLRAIRLSVELGFTIEPKTRAAIPKSAKRLALISSERIRDEFIRTLASPDPYGGVKLMLDTGLLKIFLPELLEGENVEQPKHHQGVPVLEHSLLSLKHTPSQDPLVRLAALLHDVGKPQSARGKGENRTFHGHEVIGARMTKQIMRRLKFPNADIQRVVNLVRHHMFLFQFETTDKAVRRIVRRVGNQNINDLVDLRVGDRLGSGTKIGYTTKLKRFKERVIDVQKDPIDTRMLKINGNDVVQILGNRPGPAVGRIMDALLEEVLDDPKRNTKSFLTKRARELAADLPPSSRARRSRGRGSRK
jgi:tRNA nucleotidyltransferase (CCA-adding enzyme)